MRNQSRRDGPARECPARECPVPWGPCIESLWTAHCFVLRFGLPREKFSRPFGPELENGVLTHVPTGHCICGEKCGLVDSVQNDASRRKSKSIGSDSLSTSSLGPGNPALGSISL